MEIPANIKSLMERSKLVYVGTADRSGKVHLSVAEAMSVPDREHIAFEEWFCKKTLENLRELEDVDVGAMMNGFSVNKEEEWRRYPQSAHRLYIRADSILQLNAGPHSDEGAG
jgi:soluble P-type ATPase